MRIHLNTVHLNNAGASLPSPEVLDAMIGHLRSEAELGPIEAARAAPEAVDLFHTVAARLLGSAPEEIAWCDSASRAWATAVDLFDWGEGDRIIVSRLDYGGALASLRAAATRRGAVVEVGPCDGHGRLVPDELEKLLRSGPRAVAVTHAAAHCGAVNDAVAIGRVTRAAGVNYLLDAAQSAGQMPLAVDDIGCDALVAPGRKWLRGPRGSAVLYLRTATTSGLAPGFADVATGDAPGARRVELWERSQAAAIGLGMALAQLEESIVSDAAHLDRIGVLARRARSGLEDLAGVDVWGPPEQRSGIVGFTVDGLDPRHVMDGCAAAGVTISVMDASAAPLDFPGRGAGAVCRVSPHTTNTEDEIDEFLTVVDRLRVSGAGRG